VRKAFEESKAGVTSVLLLPSRLKEYKWWGDCCAHGEVRFIHGYVRFFRCGSKKKKSANIDTTVVIFGPDIVPGSAGTPIIPPRVMASQTTDVNHVAFEEPSVPPVNAPEAAVLTSFC
jgi:hypothetical protein